MKCMISDNVGIYVGDISFFSSFGMFFHKLSSDFWKSFLFVYYQTHNYVKSLINILLTILTVYTYLSSIFIMSMTFGSVLHMNSRIFCISVT